MTPRWIRRDRRPSLIPVSVTLAALVLIATGPAGELRSECRSSSGKSERSNAPLRFDSEIVRLTVQGDSLEVEGIYRLACGDVGTSSMALFNPYPADSLLGDARTVLLEGRIATDPWHPLPFAEHPELSGVRWTVPTAPSRMVEVRTIYRQALRSSYARYIVTTTQAWGEPLEHARFAIRLPGGAEPTHFSFPFELQGNDNDAYYLFEEPCFMSDRDIIVRWTP